MRRPTGESRGFGFVEMETPEDAKDVVRNMDGAEWNGRNLKVEIAKHPRWVGRWARKGVQYEMVVLKPRYLILVFFSILLLAS